VGDARDVELTNSPFCVSSATTRFSSSAQGGRMNRTPIGGTESRINKSHTQFMAVLPLALRAAEVRTSAAVARAQMAPADREDVNQEALVAVWKALPHYDPSRASLRTFVEWVIATRFASLMRSRRIQPALAPLEGHQPIGLDGIPVLEFRTDFQIVSESLAERDRRLAALLLDRSPTEASRVLHISRSTVYEGIRRIRTAFENAGFGPRGGRSR
jgi:RNA polymerase sigma factor (sigma-70 family)